MSSRKTKLVQYLLHRYYKLWRYTIEYLQRHTTITYRRLELREDGKTNKRFSRKNPTEKNNHFRMIDRIEKITSTFG